VAAISPDSGVLVESPPGAVQVLLSEVVNERTAAARSDIAGAVLLSPVKGTVAVTWHRNRLSVRPREGLQPGRVYRLEVLPVLTDLRQNRMRQGRTAIFSTGPEIPTAVLQGAVTDWAGGRVGASALVEALLLPDSLPYRMLADSTGSFALRQIPPGDYLVYGVIDQDNNRERGPREAFDTVRLTLADSATAELFAFPHDTTGPRLRTVELADSVTLRLTFDRPLDPSHVLDTSAVRLTSVADTATPLPVRLVLTLRQADSLRAAQGRPERPDSAGPTPRDSVRAPGADTARAGRRAADTTRVVAAAPARSAPLAPAVGPRDSTRAQKMLARRPQPSAVRLLRLESPLAPGARYVVNVFGARSLSGVAATATGQVSVPLPRARTQPGRARPGADSARAPSDTAAAARRPPSDSVPPAPPVPDPPRDTARTPPPQPEPPPRRLRPGAP